MSLATNEGTPFTMPVAPVGAVNNGAGFGGFGGDALVALIMMFLFPMIYGGMGWGGMGMMGGMGMWPWMFGGFGGNGGNCGCGNPATQADVQRAVDQQTLISKIDQQTYGISTAAYDINNTLQNGFSSAELSRCNQQAALMQQLYQIGYSQQDCCCQTQRAIERANYDAAMRSNDANRLIERGFCDTNYNAATNTTAIIQNAHNDTDRVLARLDAIEASHKDQKIAEQAAEIQAYRQNAAFGAMISASEATILRRTGAECPTAAYIVQPPTPVTFPTNCCGQATFNGGWNNGCGNCGSC